MNLTPVATRPRSSLSSDRAYHDTADKALAVGQEASETRADTLSQSAPQASGEEKGGPGAQPRRSLPWGRLLVVLLLLGGGGFVSWRFEQTASTAPADLVLQGNIDVRQVNLAFKVGGRITHLAVDEGDEVKAGQVIAQLDERYFEDELRLARAQRDQAKANLEKLQHGFRAEEIEQARASAAQVQANADQRQQEFTRAQRLLAQKALAREEYDSHEAAWLEAKAKLAAATASRNLYEAGSRPEDIAAAQAQLDQQNAQVVTAERRWEDSRLQAPNDGVILTRAREQGAIVNPGETIFTLTLTSSVWVRTYVGEPDLGSIKPGMAVTVRTDAYPGTPGGHAYLGHVGFISPTAEFTPKNVETRQLRTNLVYRLRVIVADPDGGLRQGMPVTVAVAVEGQRPRTFKERLLEALGLAAPLNPKTSAPQSMSATVSPQVR